MYTPNMTPRHLAVYVRVSSSAQKTRSQEPDLRRWLSAYAPDEPVRWYRDTASGKTMERPGWVQLEEDLRAGRIAKILVWRIDRLGRTAAGLTALFDELRQRKVDLVSLKESFDLATPFGSLVANILASVSAFELEVRQERQAAGIDAARATGKRWGGRKKGDRYKVTEEVQRQIRRMAADGEPKAAIARLLGISRPTVYSVLGETNT